MPKTLDIRVSQAIARLTLIERALHSRGAFTMEYKGISAPVCRFVRRDRVSFVAHFPPLCHLDTDADEHVVTVYLDGEYFHPIVLDGPLDEDGSKVEWDLHLSEEPVGV